MGLDTQQAQRLQHLNKGLKRETSERTFKSNLERGKHLAFDNPRLKIISTALFFLN